MKVEKTSSQKELTNSYNISYVHSVLAEFYGDLYLEYRKDWARAENFEFLENAYPLQLDFELNYSCNFSCSMCTWSVEDSKSRGKKVWFDIEVYKRILTEGVKGGLKAIRLNYINEPLIRRDIVDFIKFAKDIGIIDVYLSSNGSLLTEKMSEELVKSGLDRLQISLDANTKTTFDKIRQGGDFQQIINNINGFLRVRAKFDSKRPLLRVNFVKTKTNEHEFDSFLKYWESKADNIGVQNLVNIIKPVAEQNKLAELKFNCVQPFYHLTIRYDGTVLPCCSFFGAEIPVARLSSKYGEFSNSLNLAVTTVERDSLPEGTVEEIWRGKLMQDFREMHRLGEYSSNPICRQCVMSSSGVDETQ